ncbi:glycosyltransferase involved in cell wall biosynthesis [Tenggerimyces flavus]|nr:glycosyltransferase involved in cell wall biosynthesis [Tenggerimyces flavus]
MPVLNEERFLRDSVNKVLAQDYPGPLEIVIAVGPSTDRTHEIAQEIVTADPRVRLIDNPRGITPSGLNAAIRQAQHGIVMRVDGHGILSPGYIKRAVEVLEETGADNVGGVMAAEGLTPFEQAVARAMTSALGIGGARFHLGGGAGPVDSVYLGVFRRSTLDKLGGYDETFVRAQDWELNYRIRRSGGTVWFSPDLRVTYRPRPNVRALARQFYLTGRWRRVVTRTHRGTSSLRYLAAPTASLAVLVGTLLGLVGAVTRMSLLLLGFVLPVGYALAIVLGSLVESRGLNWRARLWLPVVIATMHLTWGWGFLTSPRSLGEHERPDETP